MDKTTAGSRRRTTANVMASVREQWKSVNSSARPLSVWLDPHTSETISLVDMLDRSWDDIMLSAPEMMLIEREREENAVAFA